MQKNNEAIDHHIFLRKDLKKFHIFHELKVSTILYEL